MAVKDNKIAFIAKIEDRLNNNLINISEDFITCKDTEGNVEFVIKRETGEFIGSNSGKNKSNKRAYINFPLANNQAFMCPNYWIIAFLKYKDDDGALDNWINGHDINHINGDTLYNNIDNIEICSKAYNNIHARLMSDIHKYYPNIITEEEDCQGNKIHKFIGTKGITSKQIENWNNKHSKEEQLTSKVAKSGVFRCGYTKHFIDQVIEKFKLTDFYDFDLGIIKEVA